ncbi:DUF542 domain-containing protein [Myxococcus sp. RHSTA-1-4]|uniref:DUF542 domain-containing protein n=1 Tax=Myxococcus sp. RHSTA-1-4 TaxID=2874601 RepID=UPI001CBC1998|nr:DUF542 domain-containing protein [Myxococcus sp. RHSTA-1-4]MBZ4421965.1 DUF542 domain-containing protein [Myxococcus sp. RHSTA-1-4]
MLGIDVRLSLRDLIQLHPAAQPVLQRHGLDGCCGGDCSLQQACERSDVDATLVAMEVARVARAPADAAQWQEAPLAALITHLVEDYHRPLEEDLKRLDALAVRVLEVHGSKEPERLGRLLATLRILEELLGAHLAKEEQVLFPWILSGRAPAPVAPIQVMLLEHAHVEQCLARLRTLTNDYVAPAGACRTWRELWERLARLERELDEHTWLEDEVLFPRALRR